MRLEYRPAARDDLRSIWLHVAADNPRAATALVERIQDRCEHLIASPQIGAPRSDLRPGLRNLVVGDYLAFYTVVGDLIEIVRILHGARYLPPLLSGGKS